MAGEPRIDDARAVWDEAAATFDNEPDHGLWHPETRMAWSALLAELLPAEPGRVLDLGCGTGSLSLLLAALGHEVIGTDVSPNMLARAQAKVAAQGPSPVFQVGDAAHPDFPPGSFSAVLCRHVLWMLPEPRDVLRRWTDLLAVGGRLLLIEGFWHTGAGLRASEIVSAMPIDLGEVAVRSLSETAALWGGPVNDERFVVTAVRR
ncbi:class I SAM-dependent methyltransferase [Devosia sp. Root105]|jgi:ubiquinone/menaquinone biosynthesis C-methylase UbiE|uniref:class I SAM-dependent methyltransferase n=1 Tax=Devosia sp. Root105 TaxID=1736423 RepID=UPI0006F39B64|nr:class I SAM-dependent methyltransferase [Devosia sp. Root105]KQU99007.1 hypothetical protein ASC68_06345 [Devosia sp. Root105]